MSQANPEKAMRALVPEPVRCDCGVEVRPPALGVYALLERIASPLLTGAQTDTLGMLPTLYVLCRGAEALAAWDRLEAAAVEWADTLPPTAVGEIERAARLQVARMLDVVGQEPVKKNGPATTAGSRRSRSGRQSATDGVSQKSSGKSRPARSCSCAASGATPTSTKK